MYRPDDQITVLHRVAEQRSPFVDARAVADLNQIESREMVCPDVDILPDPRAEEAVDPWKQRRPG